MDQPTTQAKAKTTTALTSTCLSPAALLYKYQATEKLWRAHVLTTNTLFDQTEERINVLQESHYKVLISLQVRLESLEGKLEKAQNIDDTTGVEKEMEMGNDVAMEKVTSEDDSIEKEKGDDVAVEKVMSDDDSIEKAKGDRSTVKEIAGDAIKVRTAIEEAEHKRVELLQNDHTALQEAERKLRGEKGKLEMKLLEARAEGYRPATDADTVVKLRDEVDELRAKCEGQTEGMGGLEKKYGELQGRCQALQGEHEVL